MGFSNRMSFWFLSLAVLAGAVPVVVEAKEPPSIKGAYIQLPGHPFKFDGKQVEVVEFLSFYCGHCNAFERSIPIIRGYFPKKVVWKIVPIYWGNGSSKPGEAYLLAEEAGKGDPMKTALFHAGFVEKKDIGKVEVLEKLGADIGLGFDFSTRLRGGEKAGAIQAALKQAKDYGVEETPTLIIAGNILTTQSLSRGGEEAFTDNVITIIKSILQ